VDLGTTFQWEESQTSWRYTNFRSIIDGMYERAVSSKGTMLQPLERLDVDIDARDLMSLNTTSFAKMCHSLKTLKIVHLIIACEQSSHRNSVPIWARTVSDMLWSLESVKDLELRFYNNHRKSPIRTRITFRTLRTCILNPGVGSSLGFVKPTLERLCLSRLDFGYSDFLNVIEAHTKTLNELIITNCDLRCEPYVIFTAGVSKKSTWSALFDEIYQMLSTRSLGKVELEDLSSDSITDSPRGMCGFHHVPKPLLYAYEKYLMHKADQPSTSLREECQSYRFVPSTCRTCKNEFTEMYDISGVYDFKVSLDKKILGAGVMTPTGYISESLESVPHRGQLGWFMAQHTDSEIENSDEDDDSSDEDFDADSEIDSQVSFDVDDVMAQIFHNHSGDDYGSDENDEDEESVSSEYDLDSDSWESTDDGDSE
jgi:hypothetical protein